MKTRFLKTSSYIILASLFGLAAIYTLRSERVIAQGNSPGGKLEGTWRVDVTQTDCAGHTVRTFKSLITFAPPGTPGRAEGSVLEVSSASLFRSTGEGTWRSEGGRAFSADFRIFLFNATGVFTGTNKVTKTIVLGPSDDEYTATTTFEIRDPNDNFLQAGCTTDVARRYE